jgi:hypothetical protein
MGYILDAFVSELLALPDEAMFETVSEVDGEGNDGYSGVPLAPSIADV